jgi:hypothetical protein
MVCDGGSLLAGGQGPGSDSGVRLLGVRLQGPLEDRYIVITSTEDSFLFWPFILHHLSSGWLRGPLEDSCIVVTSPGRNFFSSGLLYCIPSTDCILKCGCYWQVGKGQGQDSGVSGSQLSGSGDPWKDLGNKVKNTLPDLSELPSAATNTSNRDNKNLGPNEVGKDLLGGLPNASKTDTAAPGATSFLTFLIFGSLRVYRCFRVCAVVGFLHTCRGLGSWHLRCCGFFAHLSGAGELALLSRFLSF